MNGSQFDEFGSLACMYVVCFHKTYLNCFLEALYCLRCILLLSLDLFFFKMCFDAFRLNTLKNAKYYQWLNYKMLSVIKCYSTTKLYSKVIHDVVLHTQYAKYFSFFFKSQIYAFTGCTVSPTCELKSQNPWFQPW